MFSRTRKSNAHQAREKKQAVAFFVNGLPSDYGLQMNVVVSDVSIDFGNFLTNALFCTILDFNQRLAGVFVPYF